MHVHVSCIVSRGRFEYRLQVHLSCLPPRVPFQVGRILLPCLPAWQCPNSQVHAPIAVLIPNGCPSVALLQSVCPE